MANAPGANPEASPALRNAVEARVSEGWLHARQLLDPKAAVEIAISVDLALDPRLTLDSLLVERHRDARLLHAAAAQCVQSDEEDNGDELKMRARTPGDSVWRSGR